VGSWSISFFRTLRAIEVECHEKRGDGKKAKGA